MLHMEWNFGVFVYLLTGALKVTLIALRKPKPHDRAYMKLRHPGFPLWAFAAACLWGCLDILAFVVSVRPPERRVDVAKDAVTDFCILGILLYLGSLIFES